MPSHETRTIEPTDIRPSRSHRRQEVERDCGSKNPPPHVGGYNALLGYSGGSQPPSCALTRRRAGTDFAVLWNRRKIAVGLGVLCLLTALSAVVFRLSRQRKPELQIAFLGYTNVLLRASGQQSFTITKRLFIVTNAGVTQIEIASIHQLYPISAISGHFDSYLMMPTSRIDPGKADVATSYLSTNQTPWRISLAYAYPDPKKRLVDFWGGRGNFFGRKVGYFADAFFPTQKLHWAHSEWITNTGLHRTHWGWNTNTTPRRYHINAPPPPFRFESPTNTGTFP